MALPQYLEREFERRRARNPCYSLRAFARDLGCDHSTLSQWIRSKRPLTKEASEQVCAALGARGPDREIICEIDTIDLSVVAAIREAETNSSESVARRANATIDEVNQSLFKLMRLGVLRMQGTDWHLMKKEIR
ncbi:helix-turn-helix domain-containing protein [Sphingomonas sp.]|uniref:helix-turn-helix domain-containing protein n=1 Tax=Sphingomonas sp. TaxID=28214 RepID=UPI0038AF5E06